jgi:hypothetical protein
VEQLPFLTELCSKLFVTSVGAESHLQPAKSYETPKKGFSEGKFSVCKRLLIFEIGIKCKYALRALLCLIYV